MDKLIDPLWGGVGGWMEGVEDLMEAISAAEITWLVVSAGRH